MKEFRYASNLTSHYRQHTDERPFPCTLCSKAFRQKAALKCHIQRHEKQKEKAEAQAQTTSEAATGDEDARVEKSDSREQDETMPLPDLSEGTPNNEMKDEVKNSSGTSPKTEDAFPPLDVKPPPVASGDVYEFNDDDETADVKLPKFTPLKSSKVMGEDSLSKLATLTSGLDGLAPTSHAVVTNDKMEKKPKKEKKPRKKKTVEGSNTEKRLTDDVSTINTDAEPPKPKKSKKKKASSVNKKQDNVNKENLSSGDIQMPEEKVSQPDDDKPVTSTCPKRENSIKGEKKTKKSKKKAAKIDEASGAKTPEKERPIKGKKKAKKAVEGEEKPKKKKKSKKKATASEDPVAESLVDDVPSITEDQPELTPPSEESQEQSVSPPVEESAYAPAPEISEEEQQLRDAADREIDNYQKARYSEQQRRHSAPDTYPTTADTFDAELPYIQTATATDDLSPPPAVECADNAEVLHSPVSDISADDVHSLTLPSVTRDSPGEDTQGEPELAENLSPSIQEIDQQEEAVLNDIANQVRAQRVASSGYTGGQSNEVTPRYSDGSYQNVPSNEDYQQQRSEDYYRSPHSAGEHYRDRHSTESYGQPQSNDHYHDPHSVGEHLSDPHSSESYRQPCSVERYGEVPPQPPSQEVPVIMSQHKDNGGMVSPGFDRTVTHDGPPQNHLFSPDHRHRPHYPRVEPPGGDYDNLPNGPPAPAPPPSSLSPPTPPTPNPSETLPEALATQQQPPQQHSSSKYGYMEPAPYTSPAYPHPPSVQEPSTPRQDVPQPPSVPSIPPTPSSYTGEGIPSHNSYPQPDSCPPSYPNSLPPVPTSSASYSPEGMPSTPRAAVPYLDTTPVSSAGEASTHNPDQPLYLPTRGVETGKEAPTSRSITPPSGAYNTSVSEPFPSRDFFGQYFHDSNSVPLNHPPIPSSQDQRSRPPYQQSSAIPGLPPVSSSSDYYRRAPAPFIPGTGYPSVTESLVGMTSSLSTQQHAPSQPWTSGSQEERSRHWGQPSPILMSSDLDTASPLSRNPYPTSRPDYSFPTTTTASQYSKPGESTSYPSVPQTLPNPTDRYDVASAYMSSRTFNPTAAAAAAAAAAGSNYSGAMAPPPSTASTQKQLEDAYRRAAHMSDYRSLPQPPPPPSMADVYSRMGMTPALGFDKYYYPRDAMFRSQHLPGAPNPFMPQNSTPQIPYSDREYSRNSIYSQHGAYGFMGEKQYLAASNKLPPSLPGLQERPLAGDYLQAQGAMNDPHMQDPYHRSVIYNMMTRYF